MTRGSIRSPSSASLASAVAAFYYLRVVKVMYFDEPAPGFDRSPLAVRAVLAVSTIALLVFWLYPAPVDGCGDGCGEIAVLDKVARVQLGSDARARGVRLLSLEAIDSTNDEARRLIASGERGPLWIVAGRQTQRARAPRPRMDFAAGQSLRELHRQRLRRARDRAAARLRGRSRGHAGPARARRTGDFRA